MPLVAIYERISLDKENLSNQEFEMASIIKENRWDLFKTYKETEHADNEDKRIELKNLFEDASEKKFQILLIWNMDRLTRGGVWANIDYIKRFQSLGIKIFSVDDKRFETLDTAEDEFKAGVEGYFSRKEKEKIRTRTKNALARMKSEIEIQGFTITKEGKKIYELGSGTGKIGRDRSRQLTQEDIKEIKYLRFSKAYSLRAIAKKFNCSVTPIERIIKGD